MLNENFVILGALLNVIGTISYLIQTIQGKVKPNRVTWGLWALAPLIVFIAEIKQGVGIQSLMTLILGFNPLMVFLASFVNKKSFWKLGYLDIICAILSLSGLILWYLTKIGNVAIIFSILADGLAAVPTMAKSWCAPETEDYKVFLLTAISAMITLLTVKIWTLAYYGFPTYVFLICLVMFVLIKFRIGKRFK